MLNCRMNFFASLEELLLMSDPTEKARRFQAFYTRYKKGESIFEAGPAQRFDTPSYAAFCTIVTPQTVPKRKSPATQKGQGAMLHAIAHIEYSAVDLALDHAYRFRGMPQAYYDDWLEVADEELRHFGMLNALLEETGVRYGDLPVHDALFEAAQRTTTLLERMAVVPRYFEANGLDATPQILSKIAHLHGDPMIEKIREALRLILEEEVAHVRKGDRWFEYACRQAGVDKTVYFEIIDRFYPGSYPRQRFLNVDARKAAGFSCPELNRMSEERVC